MASCHPQSRSTNGWSGFGDVRDPIRMLELVAGAEVVVLAMQGFAGPGRVSPRTMDQAGSPAT